MPQKPKSFKLILGNQKLPIDIHHLAVDAEGEMMDVGKRRFVFAFVWRQMPFKALYQEDGDSASIELVGQVGPLPFTAESVRARADLQGIIEAANKHLGPVFRVQDGRIELFGTASVHVPVTAVGLVEALCEFLLPVKPYLDCVGLYIDPGVSRLRAQYRQKRVSRK